MDQGPALQLLTNVALQYHRPTLFGPRNNRTGRHNRMSKQLAISAAASVFAMVAFVLLATPGRDEAGAMAHAAAPAQVSLEAVIGLQSISQ